MFDLQDSLTSRVVGAIAPKLQREEIKRARRKPTESLDAFDHYLRGLAKVRWSNIANTEALQLFYTAIELDPRLACAHGLAAWCYVRRKANGWINDPAKEIAEGTRLARKAVELGTDDPFALGVGGYALAFIAHEFDDAAAYVDRALAGNPNFAQGWATSAWLRVWRGEPDLALEHSAHAMRLSPLELPMYCNAQGAMAYAHFLKGRYDAAASCAESGLRGYGNFLLLTCISAASNTLTGQHERAQRSILQALERNPDLHANLRNLAPFRRAGDFAIFEKGLCEAGLPKRHDAATP